MLARCYEKKQKFEQAIEVYDNFVRQNPESKRTAQILAYKARIQRKHLKDDEEAIRTLQLLVKEHYNTEGVESYVDKCQFIRCHSGARFENKKTFTNTQ